MFRRVYWQLLGIFLFVGCSEAQEQENPWVGDLEFLKKELIDYHPGFNWYTSVRAMDSLYEKAIDRVEDGEIDHLEFYRIVRGLIAEIRCGHTHTGVPTALEEKVFSEWNFLPLSVVMVGDTVVVEGMLEGSPLERGDQILSINGNEVEDIIDKIIGFQSGDGFVNSGRRLAMARYFHLYYQLFVDSSATNYNLTVLRGSEELQVVLEGKPWEQLSSLQPVSNDLEPLNITHEPGYSILRIATFSSGAIQEADQNYSRFLREAFSDLGRRGVQHLILDLRGNGGGSDNYGAELVSYLLDKPYGYFERIVVTDDYDGYGGIEDRDGERFVTNHRGLSRWEPAKHHYDGDLYVLVDGGSFSTCADVASVLKANGRELIIGAETGGGARGNTSGNRRNVVLPHSEITVYIPLWKYTTALASTHPVGRGVIPDVEVLPTTQDFIEERDAVMEYVLRLIANK